VQLVTRGGKWYAFCYYYDARTDRRVRVRRSTGIRDDGTRKAEQRATLIGEEIERSLAAGRGRSANATTIEGAFKALVQSRELAELTNDRQIFAAVPLFEFFGPTRAAESINDRSAIEYATWRCKTHSAGTVRRELNELRQALKAIGLAGPKTPKLAPYKPRERWLEPAHAAQLLKEIPEQWRDHFVLYLQLGVRKQELYALECVTEDSVRVRGTKTAGADRVLPLSAQAREILERRNYVLPVWVNIRRDLGAACERAGLPAVSPNDLRRTFATQLARAGAPILHLKELLGHTSTRMVDMVYARTGHGPHLHKTLALLGKVGAVSNTGRGRAEKAG